jgi:hypothetical protein
VRTVGGDEPADRGRDDLAVREDNSAANVGADDPSANRCSDEGAALVAIEEIGRLQGAPRFDVNQRKVGIEADRYIAFSGDVESSRRVGGRHGGHGRERDAPPRMAEFQQQLAGCLAAGDTAHHGEEVRIGFAIGGTGRMV